MLSRWRLVRGLTGYGTGEAISYLRFRGGISHHVLVGSADLTAVKRNATSAIFPATMELRDPRVRGSRARLTAYTDGGVVGYVDLAGWSLPWL